MKTATLGGARARLAPGINEELRKHHNPTHAWCSPARAKKKLQGFQEGLEPQKPPKTELYHIPFPTAFRSDGMILTVYVPRFLAGLSLPAVKIDLTKSPPGAVHLLCTNVGVSLHLMFHAKSV